VGFTAGDGSGAGGIQQYDAQAPRGFAEIRYLDADERDDLDLKRLRTFDFIVDPEGNPVDPVQYMEDNPDGSIDIHQYGDVSLKRGGHGVALVASIDGENGTYVVTQIAAVDEATTRLYLFNIGCHYECYVQNQSLIDEIVDSWGLKEL
jgi:hypothetical protein